MDEIKVVPYIPDEDYDNPAMVVDFYEFTMANCLFLHGFKDTTLVFDMFFRKNPDNQGYSISAGQRKLTRFLLNYHFNAQDIWWLRTKGMSEEFCEYLRTYQWKGDMYALPEGTVAYPHVQMVRIECDLVGAILIETYLLQTMNFHSLIATKATRVTGLNTHTPRSVMEFGTRRAQGESAGNDGAYAAVLGGCIGTACTITDELYGVPALGTMAHAWVQMFDTEYDAFKTYCELYPGNAIMLVDTYDTLHSGIPNAIRAFDEVLRPKGITKCGIRLDSGDIAYLSRKAREMLDKAGWETATITVSNSLDEYIIRDMWMQDAKIDSFGVGERLITARSEPVFGCVYKLVAVEDKDGNVVPKIKISENVGKITTPHFKKLYRFYGRDTGKAIADYLCVYDETVDDSDKMTIFDPEATWKRKEVYHFEARELLVPIFKNGELVYKQPSLEEIRAYCAAQVDTLWDEVKRFDNPHRYYVDLSQKLYDIKQELLTKNGSH